MPGTDGLPSLSFTVTHGVDERKWKPTKLTPLGAWLRWEFNPGLSDVKACALSIHFTASRRQSQKALAP